MTDIITLGELLVDLTQTGSDANGNGIYTAYPGGAPANVAVAAVRLGAAAAFTGKVGDDTFGSRLEDVLRSEGVDISGICFSEEAPTTMAIVNIDENGERTFSFYRNPGADTRLTEEEAVSSIKRAFMQPIDTADKTLSDEDDTVSISLADLKPVRPDECPLILHIGSLLMTDSPSREACMEAVIFAKTAGMLISYDPNYREALWESREQAVEQMNRILPYADILKVSDEEMELLTGTDDLEKGSRLLAQRGCELSLPYSAQAVYDEADLPYPEGEIRLVMVTLGAGGVFIRFGTHTEKIPGISVKVADTNGAGDTFAGAVLAQIARKIRKEASEAADPGRLITETTIGMSRYSYAFEPGTLQAILEKTSPEDIRSICSFANRAASITCTRHGAIPAMPTLSEVQSC